MRDRAGTYQTSPGQTSPGGIRIFRPRPLPPNPPIEMSPRLAIALSSADQALARLDGATTILQNPDLFVYGFLRQEAVLSSQIEGTQASLEDLLAFEADQATPAELPDIREVINYLDAMDWGLAELPRLPISLRLIRELHRRLLAGTRGSDRSPGTFRDNQNWIGPPGTPIERASFVPPAVPDMKVALSDWEKFIHEKSDLPPLVKCALLHAQFETIHPFWDGNGRVGRMIITLLLCQERILSRPILYLSLYFKQKREAYYAHLQAVRDEGRWEDWIVFFLDGVTATSRSALKTAREIIDLRERMRTELAAIPRRPKAAALGEKLFAHPYMTVKLAARLLDITPPTAGALVRDYCERGLLAQVDGRKWRRTFAFRPYLDILHRSIGDLSGLIDGHDPLAPSTPGGGPLD